MSNSNNIKITKINENWSVSDKIHEWIRNVEWQEGYADAKDGTFEERVLSDDGTVDFENAYANSALWSFIYKSNEDIGSKVYEKISNIIPNIRDVETCNIHALYSIAKELGITEPGNYEYEYPEEILRLINIFSINKNLLIQKDILTKESKESLEDNIDKVRTTGPNDPTLMWGFNPNSDVWSDEEEYNIRYQQNYNDSNISPNGNAYYPEEDNS